MPRLVTTPLAGVDTYRCDHLLSVHFQTCGMSNQASVFLEHWQEAPNQRATVFFALSLKVFDDGLCEAAPLWWWTQHEIFNPNLESRSQILRNNQSVREERESQVWVPVSVITWTVSVPAAPADLWVTLTAHCLADQVEGFCPLHRSLWTSANEIFSAIFSLGEGYQCLLVIPLTAPTPSQSLFSCLEVNVTTTQPLTLS